MNRIGICSRGFRSLMVAQFLGAFNDNGFKAVLFALALQKYRDPADDGIFIQITLGATIVFIVPFILFSTLAGQLADRFSKRSMTVTVKILEVGVLALGTLGLGLGVDSPACFPVLIAALFLLAVQSALFGPTKYGLLPELVRPEELPRANGLIEMATFAAIISGTVIFFQLAAVVEEPVVIGGILLVLSGVGLSASLGITRVPPADPGRAFSWNPLPEVHSMLRVIRGSTVLRRTVIGVACFWTLAVVIDFSILFFGRLFVGDPTDVDAVTRTVGNLRGVLGIGIGVGSFLAGYLSDKKPEMGLVPVGSLGMGACIIVLALLPEGPGSLPWVYGGLALLGLAGGCFIVPLNVLLQQDAPVADKGRVIAGANLATFSATLVALGILFVLLVPLEVQVGGVILTTGCLAIAGTLYVLWLLPDALLRFVLWILVRTIYRLQVVGRENFPLRGPALLVSNHVSFVDGLLVLASTHRFVRFLVYAPLTRIRGLGWLARSLRVIPVARDDGPREVVRSLRAATDALNAGEVVCIFAEGAITRTGQLLPFRGGVKRILSGTEAPVVPVYLDRVWGSIFSFKGRRFFWKVPRQIPYPVTISFGKPLPSTSEVEEIRQAVQELGSEAFPHRKRDMTDVPGTLIGACRRHPFRRALSDSSGARLSGAGLLVGSVALARQMRRVFADEPMVGLLLPPSVGGALANVAGTLLGKPVVNFNYTVGEEVLASAAHQCGLKRVLTSRRFLEKAPVSVPGEPIFIEDLRDRIGSFERLEAALVSLCPRRVIREYLGSPPPDLDATLTVIFSSGSTGEPKGVELTHFNIISNVQSASQGFNFQTDDCLLGILPFFHSTGYTVTLWTPLLTGMSVVYHPNPLDARTVGKLTRQEKATVLVATPTFLQGYTRRCKVEDFASLRHVVVGAEKLGDAVRDGFREKFGLEPLEGYGATECSPLVSVNVPDFEHDDEPQVGAKPGIGHPLPGVSVKIVDPDTREPVPHGEQGLLLVKGPNVMKGYLNRPDLTEEVIRDGWYSTGDIASMDADGFLVLTDRLSRFAKIGGEMVPHLMVEEALNGLLDESEKVLVVTSIPDERKGERLAVVHVLDEERLKRVIDGLPSTGLPNLFLPRTDSFVYTEEIPVLGTGKVDLKGVKRLALEALGDR